MKTDLIPELLAPCGSYEALEAAVKAGADALYLGTTLFNARMNAKNFDRATLINAVDYAKTKGTNVIAISDSEFSPIAHQADHVLVAENEMVSFVDSLAAPMSLINAIIVAIAKKKQDELSVRLRRLEEIWDEYDVYDKTLG